jgi:hypothetical protein
MPMTITRDVVLTKRSVSAPCRTHCEIYLVRPIMASRLEPG